MTRKTIRLGTTVRGRWRGLYIVHWPVANTLGWPPRGVEAAFFHAHPSGAPVLREDSSWRTINGVIVRYKGKRYSVTFRRHNI